MKKGIRQFNAGRVQLPFDRVVNRAKQLGYTLPNSAQLSGLQTLITTLQSGGVWGKLDLLAVFKTTGQREFSLINIRNVNIIGQTVNAQAGMFTSNLGFTGDGVSSYIRFQFDPFFGAQWTLNSAMFGTWESSNVASANSPTFGLENAGGVFLAPRNGSAGVSFRSNRGSTTSINSIGVTTSVGLTVIDRSDSNNVAVYKNGTSIASTTATASVIGGGAISILRAGLPALFSARTIQAAVAGGSLTQAQHLTLYNSLNAYMSI